MVLGKLPVPGRPTIWITVGQGPTALAVGAGGGYFDIFTLICSFCFLLSPSLWETARYRLKYCLKGPLNPKQPTNQSILWGSFILWCATSERATIPEVIKNHVHNKYIKLDLSKKKKKNKKNPSEQSSKFWSDLQFTVIYAICTWFCPFSTCINVCYM